MRQTSKEGREQIKQHEGLRLNAYRDSANVLTIGYGHTGTVFEGQSITEAQADRLLIDDLFTAEKAVNRLVTSNINQEMFDALVSFTFNLGQGNLKRSTLLKKINANPVDPAIREEFLRWNRADGSILPGLVKRRKSEADLYFEGVKKKVENCLQTFLDLKKQAGY